MDQLNMHTSDLVNENIKKIGRLFPDCITERKDNYGKVELAIDFDKLKQELSKDVVDGDTERYQFTWPDKKKSIVLANSPVDKTLRPVHSRSVNFEDTENLFIEGDNLDALKLLRENYLHKVKMMYFDPPYNTGENFVYKDDFKASSECYAYNSGQVDVEGNNLVTNKESNGRFHTDWLNFMYPRLKVAKDLLCEDGVVFISIDDHEADNLRKMCDEIFGRQNFIANFIWEKRLNRENRKEVSVRHDYVLCYAKHVNVNGYTLFRQQMTEQALSSYKNPDNDPRGPWKSDPAHAQGGHGTKSQFYTLVAPNGKKHELPSGRCWVYTQSEMEKAIADKRIWFGADGNGVPRIKTYLYAKERGLTPETILFAKDNSTNEKAKNSLKELFDGYAVFETPKPVELVKNLIDLGCKEGIIMDFFAGSATTAQAVFEANAKDKGKRKFILVQIQEPVPEGSVAQQLGYKNICEIGEERIRRAGKKIIDEIKAKQPELFDNDIEKTKIDVGFRVLKVDSSNMNDVFYHPKDYTQDLFGKVEDNIKSDRTAEDLLFQVMLETDIPLSAKIEKEDINGKEFFNVADGTMYASFDTNLTVDAIIEVAKRKPMYFVMRNSSAASDSVITNFDTIFKTYSKDTVRKIL